MIFLLLLICLIVMLTGLFYVFMTFLANKNKEDEEPTLTKVIVSLIFGTVISLVILFFVAIAFGSTFLTNILFGFEIDWHVILFISILVIVYSFIFDDIFVKLFQYKLGKTHLFLILISIFRISIFYIINHSFSISIRKSIVFISTIVIVLIK